MRHDLARRRARVSALLAAAAAAAFGCVDPDAPRNWGDDLEPPPIDFAIPRPITPLPRPSLADAAKLELGKTLFNDPRLSADDRIACASCHVLGEGGDDGRRLSVGTGGQVLAVNAPTVLNSAFNFAQFWDGRARTLEEQIDTTVRNDREMGGEWIEIEHKLGADGPTAQAFARAYADGVTAANVIDALATYVRSLVTWNAPFDRYLAGDPRAIPEDARAGYELFQRLGCVSCHQGRNVGGNLFQHFGIMGDYFAERGAVTEADFGRYNVTGREADRFKFKVPSLRNVAETAPYFHDGSVERLEEAVALMAMYQLGRPIDDVQVARIVAFLETLSGDVDGSLL